MTAKRRKFLTIQIKSNNDADMSLSTQERQQIIDNFSNDIEIYWLPPIVKDRAKGKGAELSSVIYIFVLGLGFGFLFKPPSETISKKAGKELWSVLEKLVANIWGKQSHRAYAMSSKAYVFFEMDGDYVGIYFQLDRIAQDELDSRELEAIVSQQLRDISRNLEEIRTLIKKFNITRRNGLISTKRGNTVYIIDFCKGEWRIYSYDTCDFFN